MKPHQLVFIKKNNETMNTIFFSNINRLNALLWSKLFFKLGHWEGALIPWPLGLTVTIYAKLYILYKAYITADAGGIPNLTNLFKCINIWKSCKEASSVDKNNFPASVTVKHLNEYFKTGATFYSYTWHDSKANPGLDLKLHTQPALCKVGGGVRWRSTVNSVQGRRRCQVEVHGEFCAR